MTYANYADVKARKPMRLWHDQLIDYVMAHPTASLKEISVAFGGKNIAYLSVVMNTDMFKQRLEQRRAAFTRGLDASIQHKLLTTLDLTLDVVREQIEQKRTQIPFKDTTAFVNSTLERLGYGTKSAGVQVTVNAQPQITASDLDEARQLLRRSEAARLIEAKPVPLPEGRVDDAA